VGRVCRALLPLPTSLTPSLSLSRSFCPNALPASSLSRASPRRIPPHQTVAPVRTARHWLLYGKERSLQILAYHCCKTLLLPPPPHTTFPSSLLYVISKALQSVGIENMRHKQRRGRLLRFFFCGSGSSPPPQW
ncbi:unnamed protein product, partial [Pylaiella littoralis]